MINELESRGWDYTLADFEDDGAKYYFMFEHDDYPYVSISICIDLASESLDPHITIDSVDYYDSRPPEHVINPPYNYDEIHNKAKEISNKIKKEYEDDDDFSSPY